VIAAAGDICGSATDCAPTASLVTSINPTDALTLGDNAYQDGSLSEYQTEYDPNWGSFKSRTKPTTGNHEWHIANAQGYHDYFGSIAPADYYSYDVGTWHLIALASDNGSISNAAGSAEETWLRNDLAAHSNQCTLAYWHEPRYTSGTVHSSDTSWTPIWKDLYNANADVVLNGHVHNYERFAPQDPNGNLDIARGITEFVVGTGGESHYTSGTPIANSVVQNDTSFGVLKLTLHPGSYDWQFVPVAGNFTDSGSRACH
jgi:hypothetical protein